MRRGDSGVVVANLRHDPLCGIACSLATDFDSCDGARDQRRVVVVQPGDVYENHAYECWVQSDDPTRLLIDSAPKTDCRRGLSPESRDPRHDAFATDVSHA